VGRSRALSMIIKAGNFHHTSTIVVVMRIKKINKTNIHYELLFKYGRRGPDEIFRRDKVKRLDDEEGREYIMLLPPKDTIANILLHP